MLTYPANLESKILSEPSNTVETDMCGSRGGGGRGSGSLHLKNHKNIGFLSNTGLDSLKNQKATKPAFNVGPSSTRQRNTI